MSRTNDRSTGSRERLIIVQLPLLANGRSVADGKRTTHVTAPARFVAARAEREHGGPTRAQRALRRVGGVFVSGWRWPSAALSGVGKDAGGGMSRAVAATAHEASSADQESAADGAVVLIDVLVGASR
eukprot:6193379-Pleurochrysis_carterae.AAC.3